MKKFCDLNLRVSLRDSVLAEKMIKKASTLGYSYVGIPLPANVQSEIVSKLRQLCADVGIDFITRVNLVPKKPGELLSQLRGFRRKFELVSVACLSKPVARQAAKDRRVDLISFPSLDFRKRFFDVAEAELASNALASFEIEMCPLLSSAGFERIRLLSNLRKEVAIAEKFSIPVIISSGATNKFFMRTPRDFAAFSCLFDISPSSALSALSENPLVIVKRNRAKLSSDYVAPGIRVVRRGKDCGE